MIAVESMLGLTRHIEAGEEIHASYGAHTNDKLIVHCTSVVLTSQPDPTLPMVLMIPDGFSLPTSSHDDAIVLDQLLLPSLTEPQKTSLRDVGYLGNYTLDSSTKELCFRTQVAIRSVLLTSNEWEFFMGSGEDIGGDQEEAVVTWLQPKVNDFLKLVDGKAQDVRLLGENVADERTVRRCRLVEERWVQIAQGLKKWLGHCS